MLITGNNYGYFIPSVTFIGVGAIKHAPEKIKALGSKKALVVTDKGIVKVGVLKQVTDVLDAGGVQYVVYDGTIPNPTDENVHEAAAMYKKEGCDSLISLGGGSSHDCCKGVGFIAANGGKIHDYEGVDKSSNPFPPYVAINTTAGTGSEMTRFCIITDLSRHVKMAIVDWRCTPTVAIDDPVLMVGMPPRLTAATGMDALTHAVEAFVSTIATPLTDSAAKEAIDIIFKWLPKAVANGSDIQARDMMCYAEYLAGMAFNNASLGHVHAMAHQLGGFYNLPHGECNAILLPYVEQFNLIACFDRLAYLAKLIGEPVEGMSARAAADVFLDAIRRLSADVGIPAGLVEMGKFYGKEVKASDIPTMTGNAQKDACGLTNPRCPTDKDVIAIYTAAL